jgi:serine protease AprX
MKRRMPFNLLLAAMLLLALLPALAVAESPSRQATIHPMVWEMLQAEGGEAQVLVLLRARADLSGADALPTKEAKGRYVYETLRAVAEETQRDLRAALDAQGADYRPFYIVNAIRVRANSALVHSLAARSDVDRILPNPWVKSIPDPLLQQSAALVPQGVEGNITRVNADDVWALGYTGQGVVVAGQDTGYDWDHPALKSQYRGWNGLSADHDYNWHDAIHKNDPHTAAGNRCGFDSPEPCDDYGHGTHTMGTMVGDDGEINQIGMAPGSRWIGCRNMEQGWGTPETYMECFQFFLAPYPLDGEPEDGNPDLAPHVVNNSWSCPPYEGCDPDALEATVDALRQAGIVVVVSAGNEGSACGSVIFPPAIYQQSFSVAAFSHATDQIAVFSSRGPVTYGGNTYTKPDIAAPGVGVRSSVPDWVPSTDGYGYNSGTSMAAPHVAGAVALLLSAAPGYAGQVDAIEQILTRTAGPKLSSQCGDVGPPNNVWGWGILDVLGAVEAATAGLLRGTVIGAKDGMPVMAAGVTADPVTGLAGPKTLTDPMGRFTLTLAADTYDVTVDAIHYLSQTIANVAVISGQITTLDFLLPPYFIYLPLVARGS